MKGKQACIIRHLQVQPRSRLTGAACQTLVYELVKHLLYMRNQIPGLFEDLDWQVQLSLLQEYQHQQELQTERARLTQLQIEAAVVQHAEVQAAMLQPPKQKKRRLQTSQKRLLKFMQSAHSLLDSVTTDLFTLQQPMQLLLVFGPTASRPSEVYSLAFPALEQSPTGTPQKAHEDFARRTIRTLVMNTQDMPEGRASAGPTKMFLLVCGHFQEGCIPAGFMYKRGFQIRMKKGMQVHMSLTGAAHDEGVTTSFLDPASGNQDLSWYQCKTVLKGLRSPGSNEADRTG